MNFDFNPKDETYLYIPNCPIEWCAKNFCPEGAIITLQTAKEKRDRYARYIAEVIYQDKNLSDYLVEIGAAKIWGK